ncbi:trypsin-like peptidase domain-containing protein, partial [Actinosynnema sp. NPDC059797]
MTASDRIAPALLRVRDASGAVVGAGFLVGSAAAVTCAHVARADAVTVDFPLLDGVPLPATVVERRDIAPNGAGDVVVLSLRPPRAALPVPLVRAEDVWGHPVRVCGFPAGFDDGRWLSGELRAKQGTGWLQAELDGPVKSGFSGAPVWDERRGGVVGMLVARAGEGTAFVIPAADLGGWDDRPEPFRGLAAFDEDDELFFRGRDADVARLLDHVATRSLVLVVGPSGSGKSSLVRAGLLPALRRDGVHVTVVRLGSEPPEPPRDRRALLFVDQFEEVVREDPGLARTVLDRLVRARCRAVLTLRSDSLDEVLTASTARRLDHAVVLVGPLDAEGLRAAITEPVAVVGGVEFEDGLVERILDDAGTEPGRLPLVEFALTELWRGRSGGRLTHRAYDAIGGVSGALTRCADRLLWLPETRAREVLTRLAGPDGSGGFTRRRLPVAEVDDPEVLAALVATRLVVVDGGAVELAHQALVDRWPRLRDWLAADREFVAWRGELNQRRVQWEAEGRDPGSLLGGVALARAQAWAARRGLSAGERDFIARGRARQRREVWSWRAVAAVVTAAALVAASLWARTERQRAELGDQLRGGNAGQLALQSLRLRDERPLEALQLALAAWREAPDHPDARRAVLAQAQDRGSADRLLPLRRGGHVSDHVGSRDGEVIAVRSENPGVVVLEHGRRWELPAGQVNAVALSPDGTALAVSSPVELRLWHVPDRTVRWTARPTAAHTGLSFDATGSVLTAAVDGGVTTAWDAATGETVLDVPFRSDGAVLARDRRTLVAHVDEGGSSDVVVLDLPTGRRRTYVAATVLRQGEVVVECADGGYRAHVVATGESTHRDRPLDPCRESGFPGHADGSGQFLPLREDEGTRTFLDPVADSTYTLRERVAEHVFAVGGLTPSGGFTAHLVGEHLAVRGRAPSPDPPWTPAPLDRILVAPAPDARTWAEVVGGELRLVTGGDVRRGPAPPGATWVGFTP